MYPKIIGKLNKNSLLVSVAVLAIMVTGVLVFANSNAGFNNVLSFLKLGPSLSTEAVAKKSVDYLNKSVLQGRTATLVGFSEESGLVKITLKIGNTNYDSYATNDGRLLFPSALPLDSKATNKTGQNNTQTSAQNTQESATVKSADIKKVDKPLLYADLVSRCPFGLQMQRAMAEAVKSTPSLADFIKVIYIGDVSGNTISSMHGDAEGTENLRQICIREEQKEKYWPYVACQMKSKDAADGCLSSVGIDVNKLHTCMKDSNRGLAYAKEDFALGDKYKVQGSPTLILNANQDGQQISEYDLGYGRSAEGIKRIICDSSLKKPDFCSTTLNTNEAATSFSPTYSTPSGSSGNVVATASGPSCAPAN